MANYVAVFTYDDSNQVRNILPKPANTPSSGNDYVAADGTYKPIPSVTSAAIIAALGYTPASASDLAIVSAVAAGKENPLTFSGPLSRTSNTVSIPAASVSQSGYLSSTDWSTFNSKQSALGYTPEQVLTFSGPLSRSVNTVSIPAASTSVSGYLSSTDWNTFNGKQAALGYTPTNDANVIHTTGNETKTGNITLTGTLIFDSTYEAVTAGIGGSNAHVGMTYRGTVKAGAFGSAANGFGAAQVALGTITGTSISPQAYILPNTNGVKVTQGNRTTDGTIAFSDATYSGSLNSYAGWFKITNTGTVNLHSSNKIVWSTNASNTQSSNYDAAMGKDTVGLKVTSYADAGFQSRNYAGNADAPISAGAATFSSLLRTTSDKIQIDTPKTPASASDTGTLGQICWDANYIYVCVGTNSWKRSALSTW